MNYGANRDARHLLRALAALATDGFDVTAIHRLYPYVSAPQIEQALELEDQLADNLSKRGLRSTGVPPGLFALDHNIRARLCRA